VTLEDIYRTISDHEFSKNLKLILDCGYSGRWCYDALNIQNAAEASKLLKEAGDDESPAKFESVEIKAASLSTKNIEWGQYLEYRLRSLEMTSNKEKSKLTRKYSKKYGLTYFSSENEKVEELKMPNALCPNGHVMNYEPMTTLAELQPIMRKLEQIRNWPPNTILNGHRGTCVGNDWNCGRKIMDYAYGWHICTERAENKCDYLMRCKDCFQIEIAGP
jgi:hypothetical protein